jgi:CBS domain-containing protein
MMRDGTARPADAALGDTARRDAPDVADGGRRIAEGAAQEMERTAERYGDALRQMAHDMSRLMMVPRNAGGGLQEMQEAVGQLVSGVICTNLRMTQEMLRRTNPGAVVELQRAFMREVLETFVEGGATVLRATRRSADEALRPLEEQLGRRADGTRHAHAGQGQRGPRVAEVMTRDVRVVNAEETAQQAARLMAEHEAGAMPVGEDDRLVGMVTDRDLAVRVLAEGKDPARTKVREVMTPGTAYVFDDQDVDTVAETMRGRQVRRMPVLNRDKRLVGIVSLTDLARATGERHSIGRALSGMARERSGREPAAGTR